MNRLRISLLHRPLVYLAAFALALFSAELAKAQQPATALDLTFNGTIPGQPDGPVAVRLRLYDDNPGGQLLFEETQTVNVASEKFTALIGAATAGGVPTTVFQSTGSVWIAFALDANPQAEIGDRTAVTSSGYAHLALTAVGALSSVAHDQTLVGDGSSGAPLQVAAPLLLTSAEGIGSATVKGINTNNGSFPGAGVFGSGAVGIGVYGVTSGTGNTAGVYGQSFGDNSNGLWGIADIRGNGVRGQSANGIGVRAESTSGVGLRAQSNSGNAAEFYGHVAVAGTLQFEAFGADGSEGPLCRNFFDHNLGRCSSSLRYKTKVQPFRGGLEIINRLHPIAFTWKQGGRPDIGLGAEDVEKVEPRLTFRNEKGEIEGINYLQMNAVLINAIQQQQQRLETQRQHLETLRAELKTLRTTNSVLNTRLERIERRIGKDAGLEQPTR